MLEHAIHHAKTGAQDRHDGDLLALDLVNFHWPVPAIDGNFLGFEVRGRFVGQQTAHFLGQFTETLGADVAFAHQADLVLDQGVFDFNDFHYYLLEPAPKNRGIIQQKPRLVELFHVKTRKRFSFCFYPPTGRIRPEFYPPLLYMTGNTRD
ncbi:hypothetical protein D3C80_1064640 [compost metagenome]